MTPPTPRMRCLARALLATLATTPLVASATQASSFAVDGARLRSDPVRRIFADFATVARPAPTPSAAAHVRAVLNCNDDGPGSLRAAVAEAVDGDVIDLADLACSRITLETGAIRVVPDQLSLLGPGAGRLAIDGNRLDRVLIHPGHGNLTIEGVDIENGRNRTTGFKVAGGGCIASAGYVTLADATVRNCYAGGEGAYGGAIYAYLLTLRNSTISGNLAYGIHETAGTAAFGGAAFVYAVDLLDSTVSGNRALHLDNPPLGNYDIGGGIVTVIGGRIEGTTVSGNTSGGRGGGIASFSDLEVINSTFSGNEATTTMGGAVFMRWPTALAASNSTFTANRAARGGGIWLTAPGSRLESCIVHGNHADPGSFGDIDIQSGESFKLDGENNLVGTHPPLLGVAAGTLRDDPQLLPLAANGGPTATHALGPGSPAIDAGSNPFDLPHDQRGAPQARAYGPRADIGAYEWQPPPATVAAYPVPLLRRGVLAILAMLTASLGLVGLRRRRRPP